MARVPVATDNFNRSNGSIGANYTVITANSPVVNSNRCEHSSSGGDDEVAYWSASSFDADQYSLAKITSVSSQSYTKLLVRYQPSGGARVMVEKRYENTDFRIWWYNGSGWTQLGSTYSGGWSVNDIIAIEAEGDDVRVYQNGNLRISTTNASIPEDGYPGFGFADQADDSIDDWEGGDMVSAPTTITIQKSVAYNIRFSTTVQKSVIYRVLSSQTIQKSLAYAVITQTTVQKSLAYSVVRATTVQKAVVYKVLSAQTITKQLAYTVVTSTTVQKSLVYKVVAPVTITKQLKYTILEPSAPIQKSARYAVVTTSLVQKQTIYAVLTSTTIQKSLTYDVLSSSTVTVNKDLTYKVLRSSTLTKNLVYTIKGSVTLQKSLVYRVVVTTAITKSLSYSVLRTTTIEKQLIYVVLPSTQAHTVTKRLKYTVAGQKPKIIYVDGKAAFHISGVHYTLV